MPRVKEGARVRAYKPKTRTGCLTCSSNPGLVRRVKCDETKPNCAKCTSTGRKCDGYNELRDILTSSNKHVVLSLSSNTWGNERERRSLHFFRDVTVPQLSSCVGSEFWGRLILQGVFHEPAFKHAAVALGFLHEILDAGEGKVYSIGNKDGRDRFAVQQYNLAIKHLVTPSSSGNHQAVDICLASCVLFTCFESLRGHHGAAVAHIGSGVKILRELQFNKKRNRHEHPVLYSSSTPYIPLEMLEMMFTVLDTQITQLTGKHEWNLYNTCRLETSKCQIPSKFQNSGEALNYLDHYWYHYMYCQMNGDQHDVPSAAAHQELSAKYFDLFLRWSVALDAYINDNTSQAPIAEQYAISLLKIRRCLAVISFQLQGAAIDDQTVWDSFMPIYLEILTHASVLAPVPPSSTRSKKSFTMNLGIIGPLFDVAAQCRDPVLRRKAILYLKSLSRQEGVWDSDLVARVAERIVAIEEEGLKNVNTCADVPEWARISSVEPTFDAEERRVILKYRRLESPLSRVRKSIVEILEWYS